jgi:hypothetical protein
MKRMKRLQPTPSTTPVDGFSVRTKQAKSRGGRFLLAGLVVACCLTAIAELKAGDPAALSRWYNPYTPEPSCAPYTRSYGYTPTRWHKWPTVSKATQEPETVATPRRAAPVAEPPMDNEDELPLPNPLTVPDTTEQPGPNPDEPEMAPPPPSGAEPVVPPGAADDSGKPSQDLDELFPNEAPAKGDSMETPSDSSDSEPPASDDASPDAAGGDATPQSRRGSGRRTSYESSPADTKIHWRRSPRLTPSEAPDARTSGESRRAAPNDRRVTQSPRHEVPPVTATVHLASNPLRGTRSLPPTVAAPPSMPEPEVASPAVDWSTAALSSGSPQSGSNPLRSSH